MSESVGNVLGPALKLSLSPRANVAAELPASHADAEPTWASEIEQRITRVRRGEAKGRSWSDVRDSLKRK